MKAETFDHVTEVLFFEMPLLGSMGATILPRPVSASEDPSFGHPTYILGGCQNYGPLLAPFYSTAPNIQGTQKGTIVLTTTLFIFHMPALTLKANLVGPKVLMRQTVHALA